MVARAWGGGDRVDAKKQQHWQEPTKVGVEEMFVQNDAVSLCLLLNRRTKTMRVVDFRAGPSHAKRVFVLKLAKREGIEKVYTLVERDEVSTWVKLGFAKEANIPGFYKRSDAFMLGCSVADADLHVPASLTDLGDDDDEPAPVEPSAAHELMEKTLATAKKHNKELLDRPLPVTKLAVVRESEVKKTIEKAVRTNRAMTAFEPFGRDVERRYFSVSVRGGFQLVASTESQACFGNTYLELLVAPRNDAERLHTAVALRALCERLLASGVVSCFSLAPSNDVALAAAFLHNGFRRTGLLIEHLVVGAHRRDAILWSRKLANPADE